MVYKFQAVCVWHASLVDHRLVTERTSYIQWKIDSRKFCAGITRRSLFSREEWVSLRRFESLVDVHTYSGLLQKWGSLLWPRYPRAIFTVIYQVGSNSSSCTENVGTSYLNDSELLCMHGEPAQAVSMQSCNRIVNTLMISPRK